jgi:hypothetical protein
MNYLLSRPALINKIVSFKFIYNIIVFVKNIFFLTFLAVNDGKKGKNKKSSVLTLFFLKNFVSSHKLFWNFY